MDHSNREFLQRPSVAATLMIGEIVALQEERYLVRSDGGDFLSQRAESCLLLPTVGDRVLLTAQLPDDVFLLAVLERSRSSSRTLSLGEGTSIEVDRPGHLLINADSALRLRCTEMGLVAQRANLLVGQFSSTVRDAFFGFSAARFVGEIVETSLHRVVQWFGSSHRTVGGLDCTRAGSVDIHVDQVMNLQGQQVMVSAEKLVRVDGDQVHIG